MKKGFTLIELLAVIVILAIIGVITVPIIGNVIEESKKQALEASIRGLIEATDYFALYNDGVYEFQFNENNKGVTPGGDILDYTGSVDAEGKLILDSEGNISLCLMNDNYYAYKNYNSGIVVEKRNGDSCNVEYDALTNKYIAFLESEGSSSNVYSKDEVDNLITNLQEQITTNTKNIENLSSIVASNTSEITSLKNKQPQTIISKTLLKNIGDSFTINTIDENIKFIVINMYSYDSVSLLDSMTIIGNTLPQSSIYFNYQSSDYHLHMSFLEQKVLSVGTSTQYYGVMVEAVGFY